MHANQNVESDEFARSDSSVIPNTADTVANQANIRAMETAIEKGTTSAGGRSQIGNRKGNHLADALLIVSWNKDLQRGFKT
jgi:hypothetical protein